jgi:putative protein kinase ArgK-like GTPase of G3E family
VFVVNKADRADAENMVQALQTQLHVAGKSFIPVIKTIAVESKGIDELIANFQFSNSVNSERKEFLMLTKALKIIQRERMKNIDVNALKSSLKMAMQNENFSLFKFVQPFI